MNTGCLRDLLDELHLSSRPASEGFRRALHRDLTFSGMVGHLMVSNTAEFLGDWSADHPVLEDGKWAQLLGLFRSERFPGRATSYRILEDLIKALDQPLPSSLRSTIGSVLHPRRLKDLYLVPRETLPLRALSTTSWVTLLTTQVRTCSVTRGLHPDWSITCHPPQRPSFNLMVGAEDPVQTSRITLGALTLVEFFVNGVRLIASV